MPTRGDRAELAGFLAFSHGWTWAWWGAAGAWAHFSGETIWELPAAIAFYVGGAGVFLGGVAMTYRTGGRTGVRDLFARCIDPRRTGPAWWLLVLLFYPVLTLLAAALAHGLGLDASIDVGNLLRRAADPLPFLAFLGFILLIGPLPEEIGWRGYLLDRLLRRHSALAASLVVALAWWSWHLPLGWLPGYFDAFDGTPAPPWRQLLSLLPTAVLYTWIYANTRRSVLAVIAFHFLGNLTGQLLLPSGDVRSVRLALEVGAAMAVLAYWGPRTLSRQGRTAGLERLRR
jgi:uncharacterized protein